MKKICIIAIIILAILFLIGNSKNKNNNNNNNNNSIIINKNEEVQIISHTKNTYSINVIIKNNTTKNLEYVKVIAICYDKNGNNLGTKSNGQYNINNTENYKINIYIPKETKSYKLNLEYK
ncbi:MAG: hypothetical protein HFJ60_04595 [Clostridia bacterium]|nr:hypothetical protein [Clostridia bacterium]